MTSTEDAGKHAAERTPEEQQQVLDEAKPATDKQVDQVAEAAGGAEPAPDHTSGTDADSTDPAKVPELSDDKDAPEAPAPSDGTAELLDAGIVRHVDQREGVTSASAFNASIALGLKGNTEWNATLVKAIKAFQKELGQKETGYLTRDQCRRLKLTAL